MYFAWGVGVGHFTRPDPYYYDDFYCLRQSRFILGKEPLEARVGCMIKKQERSWSLVPTAGCTEKSSTV